MKPVEILVRDAQGGDLAAFELLVREFQDMAVGYGFSILRDFELAEDAAQEAFLEAYQHLKDLREPRAFVSWFRSIIFKHADRQIRGKRIPTLPLERAQEAVSGTPSPRDTAEKQELQDRVLEAIRSLPEEERTVTVLFYINGYSMAEVGDFLGIPATTVNGRLHSSRKKLRERIPNMTDNTLKQHAPGDRFTQRILQNIERIGWHRRQENTAMASLTAAMRSLGESVSYDYLMGVSGAAFRLQMTLPVRAIYAPSATRGFNCFEVAMSALGYPYEALSLGDGDPDKEKTARKKILASIDKGRPVLWRGLRGTPECGLIVGYLDEGKQLLCRTYFDPGEEYAEVESLQWGGMIIGDKCGAPRRWDAILKSLGFAVELANHSPIKKEDGTETFLLGFAAYESWISLLRDEAYWRANASLSWEMQTNAWCNICLADARGAAARYLRSIASEFGSNASTLLDKAARSYEEVHAATCEGADNTRYPWNLSEGQVWSQELREAQALALETAGIRKRSHRDGSGRLASGDDVKTTHST